MDAGAAAPRPSRHHIKAKTTALNLLPLPSGERSQVVLHLAVTETHEWFGIGGRRGHLRRPRLLSRELRLILPSSGDPELLRRQSDNCRRLIVWTIMNDLCDQGFRGISAADWDAAAPRGVEAGIAKRARAPPGDGACVCEVSIRIGVDFVYSEAAALLSACANASDPTGDSICLEEMAAEGLRLPGCAHGFHSRCIGRWFEKASTCPLCRCDKLWFLPPDYRAVHDMMLSPEGSG